MDPKPKRKTNMKRHMEKQLQQLLEERGTEINSLAKKAMFESEKYVKSKEVRNALHYFLDEYWTDLVRPTLMSIVSEAAGGNPQTITSAVIPIMLMAGGVDIHDDIIDKSKLKNKRLTVFGKFGQDIALLTGDALLFKGLLLLHLALQNAPKRKAKQVLSIFEKTFFELGDAEALELTLKGKINTKPDEYLQVINRKAADVEAYTQLSALLSNGTREGVDALRKYGRILGTLAIIRDDLIDMTDREELSHRLENEVVPLPMLYAFLNPEAQSAIASLLSKKRKTKKDIGAIVKIVTENEGFIKTKECMDVLAKQALTELIPVKYKKEELELLINTVKTI